MGGIAPQIGGRGGNLPRAELVAQARGLVTETGPWHLNASSGVVATAGVAFGTLVYLFQGDKATNIITWSSAAGTSTTLVKLCIWKKDGTLVATTADVHATYNATSTGFLSTALTAPYVVPASDAYYVGIVVVGGTGPSLARTESFGSSGVVVNGGVRSHMQAGTQTDAASVTPADAGSAIYFGIS